MKENMKKEIEFKNGDIILCKHYLYNVTIILLICSTEIYDNLYNEYFVKCLRVIKRGRINNSHIELEYNNINIKWINEMRSGNVDSLYPYQLIYYGTNIK